MVKKIKTAVLVSGSGTNLQALIDADGRGELPHVDLALVVASKPDAFALGRAEKSGIPGAVVARKAYGKDIAAYERDLAALLEEYEIEFIVLAGFLVILSAEFTKKYSGRIINVHPALIPSFCGEGFYGLRVHEAALAYGVKVSGATVHLVNEVPDGGRILLQKAVDVRDNDTPETLQRRVMEEAEWLLLPRAAEMMCKELSEQKDISKQEER